eukprot:TRINITY_DN49148_c0_g2_i1.p1 TRINITY_DN49148_c0_g2~~TRINITY_DN49148_c0_g2_i1.p1  ORF type:complete len:396 (-),score=44.24 TRINITY_DN49148_c0_g2_i1:444-1631(-)
MAAASPEPPWSPNGGASHIGRPVATSAVSSDVEAALMTPLGYSPFPPNLLFGGSLPSRARAARRARAEPPPDPDAVEEDTVWGTIHQLVTATLDRAGFRCHQRVPSSRTLSTLRHGLYSSLMTISMVLVTFVVCYIYESDCKCQNALLSWTALVCFLLALSLAYRAVGRLAERPARRFQLSNLNDLSPGCRLCFAIATATSVLCLWCVTIYSTRIIECKTCMLFVIAGTVLVFARCSWVLVFYLLNRERCVYMQERAAFRQRIANNVLRFEDMLELRPRSGTWLASSTLEEQTVVEYDEEAFGDAECCICSSSFDDVTEIRRAACGHAFHSACLAQWLPRSPTCPLCREDLGRLGRRREAERLEAQLAQIIGTTAVPTASSADESARSESGRASL